MAFLKWVKSLFRPKPVVRDLSRMATGDDASAVEETVDTSGGPLKPQHLRRALRDPRLLPKPKPKVQPYVWPRPKKPKILERDEADRLFSTTLRTKTRNIRDLTSDQEQLQRYGLPVWETELDLAQALGIDLGTLRHHSIHRVRETSPHYVTFAVPKRRGGHRLIHAPKRRLKAIQRKLHELLVSRLPVAEAAHGFRSGRSVATNAACHVGKDVLIKLDLKDCFPTIHYGRVRGLLIALGYAYPVATILAVLMTEAPRQPVDLGDKVVHVPVGPRVCVQGAPTSPGICNAVLQRLDRRLAGLARRHEFTYTRYADDLTFSGNDAAKIKLLITVSARIIRDEGFEINREKTRVLRKGQCQHVTGVVVNQEAGLSRRERRRLRAAIHHMSLSPEPPVPSKRQQLAGKLAYLHMLNPTQAATLIADFQKAIEKSA